MKKILLMLVCIFGIFCIGCGSEEVEESKEEAKTFAITDGKLYEDIETLENGRAYVIPEGKWEVTKVEDGNMDIQKISISSDKSGNRDFEYDKTFTLEVANSEKTVIMMTGEGMQLYFKEIQD